MLVNREEVRRATRWMGKKELLRSISARFSTDQAQEPKVWCLMISAFETYDRAVNRLGSWCLTERSRDARGTKRGTYLLWGAAACSTQLTKWPVSVCVCVCSRVTRWSDMNSNNLRLTLMQGLTAKSDKSHSRIMGWTSIWWAAFPSLLISMIQGWV